MHQVLPGPLHDYLAALLPERDATLAEMEAVAKEHSIPIIGPLVGRLLHQLARMSGATRVFEMGSAIGYSTIWLARAVGDGGKVYYTDGSASNAEKARDYLRRAGVADRVEVLVGDALDLLARTEGTFDLIFNDVDKHDYPKVFSLALPRIRRGGLLVTDNVLWSGQVVSPSTDAWTQAIQEYNRLSYASSEVWTTIIPLRDGVAVSVKLH
ncbi:MAG: O-methyltransferase [Candidatus Latescibacteria bacterium]|nr:O-methyltransferase [Candidatus Latescibacterota bacterium]